MVNEYISFYHPHENWNHSKALSRGPPGMDLLEQIDEQDVIVENQRGVMLFGYPFFSGKLLFPHMDPSNFQIMNLEKGTLNNMKSNRCPIRDLYPLDDDDSSERWLVDMRYGDVDDQGWVYSWAFRHGRWRGTRGTVRRRLWVREKVPEGITVLENQAIGAKRRAEHCAEGNTSLITVLQSQLLDRLKFEILYQCDRSVFQDLELSHKVQQCFQYASSKRKFEDWLKRG